MKSLRVTNLRDFFETNPNQPFKILAELEQVVLDSESMIEFIDVRNVKFQTTGYNIEKGYKKIYYRFITEA